MILQNLDAMSEKIAKNGFFVLISFRGTQLNLKGMFSIADVVWQSFEKIGADCRDEGESMSGKNSTQNIMAVPLLHRWRPKLT